MRLFVSLDAPENIIKIFENVQRAIKASKLIEATYVQSKLAHITLAFMPKVDQIDLPKIIEKLNKIDFEQFDLFLYKVEIKNRNSIIWLEVNNDILKELALKIHNSLINFINDNNTFHGHITLARIKSCSDLRKLHDLIEQIELEKAAWHISNFKLKESITYKEGPVYKTIFEFYLK